MPPAVVIFLTKYHTCLGEFDSYAEGIEKRKNPQQAYY